MRSFLLALATTGLILSGCGGAADTGGTTPRNRAAKQRKAERQAEYQDENSVGMSDERVSRWRWGGSRKDCFYVVGNQCFTSEEAACRAAGCSDVDRCDYGDGAPVKVRCPSADKKRKRSRR